MVERHRIMSRYFRLGVCFGVLGLAAGWAEDPLLIFEPLAKPLKLPPGLVQTIPVNKESTFFGDMLRAVDCTEPIELPFGTCGNQLFGGVAMVDSHLHGDLTIRFVPITATKVHFYASFGALFGDDSVLQAPYGYELPVLNNQVLEAPIPSEGDLDLTTGGATNLKFNVLFSNTALVALGGVNPKLESPIIAFPGVRGSAWGRFEQRADGRLDFTFRGSTFLPLGKDVLGDPVRWPMPMCGPDLKCASILARGTSLHPHLYMSTKAPEGDPCGLDCPDIPTNTIQEFTIATRFSAFGDDFGVDIPQLGGVGPGRSHVQGRLQIQFGPRTGNTIPFAITSLVPPALLARPPESPILGHGPLPGLLGQEEFLRFPLLTYRLQRVVFVDEPYNFPSGAIDVNTGRVIGDMVYPSFYGQSLADALFNQNDGRISKDPFFMVADRSEQTRDRLYALFEKGPNGQVMFRLSAEHKRSFATYRFPSPDFIKANSWISGPNGALDLFLRLQAARPVDKPTARKTGGQSNVVSSLGDTFSYTFSIPCDPAGQSFSFEYTNNNTGVSGGTFKMSKLASVSCINSRTSRLGPGDYDTIQVTGFGHWNKDASDAKPRFLSAHICLNPDSPYVGILVFQDPDASTNVVLSSANTKPPDKPIP
jgi:hypothetical protein